MRKCAIFVCLVILSLTACKKERFDMDLLYGSWIRLPDTGHPRPMIDFNVSGDYTYIDFLNIPAGARLFTGSLLSEIMRSMATVSLYLL